MVYKFSERYFRTAQNVGCHYIVLCSFDVSVATVVGTAVAFFIVPMRSLGQDNWKIASALMGSYIGGGK